MSVPRPAGKMPAATAAAVPPEDPPGIRSGSAGFRIAPVTVLFEVIPNASSCMPDLAPMNPPASMILVTEPASFAGMLLRRAPVPAEVG